MCCFSCGVIYCHLLFSFYYFFFANFSSIAFKTLSTVASFITSSSTFTYVSFENSQSIEHKPKHGTPTTSTLSPYFAGTVSINSCKLEEPITKHVVPKQTLTLIFLSIFHILT